MLIKSFIKPNTFSMFMYNRKWFQTFKFSEHSNRKDFYYHLLKKTLNQGNCKGATKYDVNSNKFMNYDKKNSIKGL